MKTYLGAMPIPRIGGIAIFLGMLGPLLAVLVLSNAIGDAFRESEARFLALLGCSWTSGGHGGEVNGQSR